MATASYVVFFRICHAGGHGTHVSNQHHSFVPCLLLQKMALPDKMRAAVCHGKNQPLAFEEVPMPAVADDEVLMRVEACGVCHSDAMLAQLFDLPDNHVLGHEGAGVVVALGKNATASGVKVGDRILAPVAGGSCGTCEYCQRGLEQQCAQKIWYATHRNGFFAEYCAVRPSHVVKIPENVSFAEAGPIGCAGVTTYAGLKRTEAKAGDWVGISGAGGLGQLACQIGKSFGFKVGSSVERGLGGVDYRLERIFVSDFSISNIPHLLTPCRRLAADPPFTSPTLATGARPELARFSPSTLTTPNSRRPRSSAPLPLSTPRPRVPTLSPK